MLNCAFFEAFSTLLGSHVFPVCNRFKLWDVQTWVDSTGILFDKPSQDLHNPCIWYGDLLKLVNNLL